MTFIEQNAHKMVANLCEEMAQTVYEECASKYNHWYEQNPDRRTFVKQCAPTLRAEARQILATMLTDEKLAQADKDRIYEALCLDSFLPPVGPWSLPTGTA